jgi:hypothetical protein
MQVRTTREHNRAAFGRAAGSLVIALTVLKRGFDAHGMRLGRLSGQVGRPELLNARRKAGAYSYSMILGHGSALIFHLKSLRTRSKTDTPSR